MMESTHFIQTPTYHKLASILNFPKSAKALVLLNHGYASSFAKHSETTTILAERLAQANIASIRFDFRGHGLSDGELREVTLSSGISDLETIYAWAKEKLTFEKVAVMGNSYGGFIAFNFAAQHPETVACLLKAPALYWAESLYNRYHSYMTEWQTAGSLLLPGQVVAIPYQTYLDATQYKVEEIAAQVSCPVLALHGSSDQAIPHQQTQRLVKCLGEYGHLEILPNADHRFSNPSDGQRFFDSSLEFLIQALKD